MDKNAIEAAGLLKAARQAKEYARAKYSGFKVGVALLTRSGQIVTGANVESSSYGLSLCAERVALGKALSEGMNDFKAIAIVARDGQSCPPCGACRQLLYDYAPDLVVILEDGERGMRIFPLKDLLPHAFDETKFGDA